MGSAALTINTYDIKNHREFTYAEKNENWYRADMLSSMHRSVHLLGEVKNTYFCKKKVGDELWAVSYANDAAKHFIESISAPLQLLRQQYKNHDLSPIFEAFECVSRRIPTNWLDCIKTTHPSISIDKVLRRLNVAARSLCARLGSASNKRKYSDFRRNAQKRFHSIINYFHTCMRKRSNLTVIRIDLHLNNVDPGSSEGIKAITEEQLRSIQSMRDAFLKHTKATLKSGLIGYLDKFEVGLSRGIHIHFIALLDAAIHQRDVTIAKLLGEEWKKKITSGRGNYFNCNARKDIYKYRAIGKISANDPNAIIGLRLIAAYLSLGELYAKAKFPTLFRSLRKGLAPQPANSRGGRPSSHLTEFDIRSLDIRSITRGIKFI